MVGAMEHMPQDDKDRPKTPGSLTFWSLTGKPEKKTTTKPHSDFLMYLPVPFLNALHKDQCWNVDNTLEMLELQAVELY